MNKKTKTIIGICALAVFIVLAAVAYNLLSENFSPKSGFEESSSGSESGEAVIPPDFTAYDKDGNKVKLSDYFGKPIVLNFWATWCGYCKQEMPYFDEVYKEVKDDVVFLMVDIVDGVRETKEMGEKYIEENGFTFPVLYDLDGEAAANYGLRSFPTTVIIDKDGTVFGIQEGALPEEALRAAIESVTS